MKTLKKQSALILAGMLTLTACSKTNSDHKEPGADSGACSSQFSVEFNGLVAKIKDIKAAPGGASPAANEKLGKSQELHTLCEKFFGRPQVTSCQGFDSTEARTRTLSVFEVKPACDEAAAYVREHAPTEPSPTPGPQTRPEQPGPRPQPQPQPQAKKLERYLGDQIKVVITDLETMKKAFNNQALVLSAGRVKKLKEAGAVYCFVSSADQAKWNRRFSSGMALKGVKKDEHGTPQSAAGVRRSLRISLEDETIGFGCGKTSDEPFTVAEIREAVRGILELRISNEGER